MVSGKLEAEQGLRASEERTIRAVKALETYLRSLSEDHASGEAVEETSGYDALQNLLNAAGEGLSPRVRAIINTKNRGAGIPDSGLFTVDQFGRDRVPDRVPSQLPERGAVEVNRDYLPLTLR